MPLWALHFFAIDPDEPMHTTAQLGLSIVPGHDFAEAIQQAVSHGCYAGGRVDGTPLPDTYDPPREYLFTLLDAEQVRALNHHMRRHSKTLH